MARKPQVRYFSSREGYYCQYKGKQHRLADGPDDAPTGPTYLEALQKFRDLMALDNAAVAKDQNTVRVVLEMYLRWVEASGRKKTTFRIRQRGFVAFCNAGYGEMRLSQLTQFMVLQFLESRRRPQPGQPNRRVRPWGQATCRMFLDSLNAALNWGVRSGLITTNPVAGMEKPPTRSRGRDCIVSPETHQVILKHASKWLRPVIVLLENTGARPGEIAAATAADWRPALGAFVFHAEANRQDEEFSHKTARKGKGRVIFVSGDALELVQQLVHRYPDGPLVRTRYGKPWTTHQICEEFDRVRGKVGLPGLTAYSYRHTFATNWLKAGRSIEVLAELLGNSPGVIRKHYSHLCDDLEGLRAQVDAFRAGAETQTPRPRLHAVGE